MNFKPFYVKIENLSKSGVANIWEIAQENGAKFTLDGDVDTIMGYEYIGVDYENYLLYSDDLEYFSCDLYDCEAVELTYEQAIDHMKGEASTTYPKEQEILALKKELQELKDSVLCERKGLKQKLSQRDLWASNWCNYWKDIQSLKLWKDYRKSEIDVINLIGYYEGLEEAYIEAKLLIK